MGALSAKSDSRGQHEDGELTFLGRVLAHLPVDLYLGKMVVLGHIFGCLNECLIIGQSINMIVDWTICVYRHCYNFLRQNLVNKSVMTTVSGNVYVAINIFYGLFTRTKIIFLLSIAASRSLKSFFAIPSMQQLAGHR